MIQCIDCEFGVQLPNGNVELTCDPARNIKEPECLSKLMLMSLRGIEMHHVQSSRLLPLTEQILQHVGGEIVERELDESWKSGGADEDEPGAS